MFLLDSCAGLAMSCPTFSLQTVLNWVMRHVDLLGFACPAMFCLVRKHPSELPVLRPKVYDDIV